MPNIKSAKKRLRQSLRRRAQNRSIRSEIRTRTRTFLQTGSREEAEEAYRKLASLLDRAARKRILHPNAAARHKSRLAQRLSQLG